MFLTNSQYEEIMSGYSIRQNDAYREQAERIDEVYRNVPEYKALHDKISQISSEATVCAIKGDRSLLDTLESRIAAINSEMEKLLKEHGYSPDYLKPVYVCAKCKDTGFIRQEKCSCFIQASIELLYRQSNLANTIGDCCFDNFRLDYYPETLVDNATKLSAKDNARRVLDCSRAFVYNFPSGENLLFYGDTGVGKTFLSNCIARELLNRGNSVLYLSATSLFEKFSDYENKDTTQVFDCDLLIIDDLGTELSNNFTNSKLFECINQRLLYGKSTIISTNLTIKGIMERYSERIFSRISSSYKLLKMYGDDIRFKK